MNLKWGVMIMNDNKRIVAGHVKDGRLAVYDMKGNLLCNASPEDEAFIMNVKHAFSGCDLIVGYEPQKLISFIVKHGIILQSYDFIDISFYTDFDFNRKSHAQSADLQSMTLPNYTVSLSMEMRLRMMHSSSLEHSCFLENV